MGKKAELRRNRQRANEEFNRTRNRAKRKLDEQDKAARIRARYGPSGRPAPVVVRSIDGEVRHVVDQGAICGKRAAERPYSPRLDAIAQAAGFGSYAHYLASPHWRELRLRVLERDGHSCRMCRKEKTGLTVHPDSYDRLGTSDISRLKTLCWTCHRGIHGRQH